MAKGDTAPGGMPNAAAGINFRQPFMQNPQMGAGGMSPMVQGGIGPSQGGFMSILAKMLGPQINQGPIGFPGGYPGRRFPPMGIPMGGNAAPPATVPGSPGSIAPSGATANMLQDRYSKRSQEDNQV